MSAHPQIPRREFAPSRPIKRGPLTEYELGELVRRADAGWSTGRIASVLNRHPSTIYYRQLALGCYPEKPVRRPGKPGRACVPFVPDEDAFISACRVAGHNLATIARAASIRFGLRRNGNSIKLRLLRLAAAAGAHDD